MNLKKFNIEKILGKHNADSFDITIDEKDEKIWMCDVDGNEVIFQISINNEGIHIGFTMSDFSENVRKCASEISLSLEKEIKKNNQDIRVIFDTVVITDLEKYKTNISLENVMKLRRDIKKLHKSSTLLNIQGKRNRTEFYLYGVEGRNLLSLFQKIDLINETIQHESYIGVELKKEKELHGESAIASFVSNLDSLGFRVSYNNKDDDKIDGFAELINMGILNIK